MASKFHSVVNAGSRHATHNLEYADSANRIAGTNEGSGIVLSASNDFQEARQTDNDTFYKLLDGTGPTWAQEWVTPNASLDPASNGVKFAVGVAEFEFLEGSGSASANITLGGPNNFTQGDGNSVLGGGSSANPNAISSADTNYAVVCGGLNNNIFGNFSTYPEDATASAILGGSSHNVQSSYAVICGGLSNGIGTAAKYGFIGAGNTNSVTGEYAGIMCGESNGCGGSHSAVLGGENNSISGARTMGVGCDIIASNDGCVVLSDGSGTGITTALDNSLVTYMTNGHFFNGSGVSIGSSTVTSQLDVKATGAATFISKFLNASGNINMIVGSDASQNGYVNIGSSTGASRIKMNTGTAVAQLEVTATSDNKSFAVFKNSSLNDNFNVTNDTFGNCFIEIKNSVGTTISKISAVADSFIGNAAYNFGLGTSTPTHQLDVNADSIRLRTPKTPASASDTGTQGEIAWDSNYIYVCVATDTWKRTGIATW